MEPKIPVLQFVLALLNANRVFTVPSTVPNTVPRTEGGPENVQDDGSDLLVLIIPRKA